MQTDIEKRAVNLESAAVMEATIIGFLSIRSISPSAMAATEPMRRSLSAKGRPAKIAAIDNPDSSALSHAHYASQPSVLAQCSGDRDSRDKKTHAALGHQNHDDL